VACPPCFGEFDEATRILLRIGNGHGLLIPRDIVRARADGADVAHFERNEEFVEPARGDNRVAVQEHHDISARLGGSLVASSSKSLVLVVGHDLYPSVGAQRVSGLVGGAVVDNDDLVTRSQGRTERQEAPFSVLPGVPGRNHDGGDRPVVPRSAGNEGSV
jgi:hypothetical protein